MPALLNVSRFYTVTSAPNAGVGIFRIPLGRIQVVQISYSFQDANHVFNTVANNSFQAKIALIRGAIDFDPATFTPTTDLSRFGFNLIGEFFIGDLGPTPVPFHPDTEESWIEGDEGLTIVLSQGISFISTGVQAGTSWIGKLVPASRFERAGAGAPRFAMSGAGAGAGAGGSGGTGAGAGAAGHGGGPQGTGGHRIF